MSDVQRHYVVTLDVPEDGVPTPGEVGEAIERQVYFVNMKVQRADRIGGGFDMYVVNQPLPEPELDERAALLEQRVEQLREAEDNKTSGPGWPD